MIKKLNVKVIFSSGGKFYKNREQKIADDETGDGAKQVADALIKAGYFAEIVKVTPSSIGLIKNINADTVFNLCEWSGRDYPLAVRVLKILEKGHIPYTGADSKSYQWCSDKISMKKMFDRLGIPTPAWTFVNPNDAKSDIIKKVDRLSLPIIVKPAYEHCGIGIDYKSVIRSKKDSVKKIVRLLRSYKEPVIIEEFIEGREFTTSVLKNHSLHVFPPAEVRFHTKNRNKLLSFATKWLETGNTYSSSVLKDAFLSGSLKRISKKIFTKMDCKGYIRIDLRMDNKKKKMYVLEVNINPSIWPEDCYGLTVSTEAEGWKFERLVDEIARAATVN